MRKPRFNLTTYQQIGPRHSLKCRGPLPNRITDRWISSWRSGIEALHYRAVGAPSIGERAWRDSRILARLAFTSRFELLSVSPVWTSNRSAIHYLIDLIICLSSPLVKSGFRSFSHPTGNNRRPSLPVSKADPQSHSCPLPVASRGNCKGVRESPTESQLANCRW